MRPYKRRKNRPSEIMLYEKDKVGIKSYKKGLARRVVGVPLYHLLCLGICTSNSMLFVLTHALC